MSSSVEVVKGLLFVKSNDLVNVHNEWALKIRELIPEWKPNTGQDSNRVVILNESKPRIYHLTSMFNVVTLIPIIDGIINKSDLDIIVSYLTAQLRNVHGFPRVVNEMAFKIFIYTSTESNDIDYRDTDFVLRVSKVMTTLFGVALQGECREHVLQFAFDSRYVRQPHAEIQSPSSSSSSSSSNNTFSTGFNTGSSTGFNTGSSTGFNSGGSVSQNPQNQKSVGFSSEGKQNPQNPSGFQSLYNQEEKNQTKSPGEIDYQNSSVCNKNKTPFQFSFGSQKSPGMGSSGMGSSGMGSSGMGSFGSQKSSGMGSFGSQKSPGMGSSLKKFSIGGGSSPFGSSNHGSKEPFVSRSSSSKTPFSIGQNSKRSAWESFARP
jgi:hypothetical protein